MRCEASEDAGPCVILIGSKSVWRRGVGCTSDRCAGERGVKDVEISPSLGRDCGRRPGPAKCDSAENTPKQLSASLWDGLSDAYLTLHIHS
jgi:hypothetical protein